VTDGSEGSAGVGADRGVEVAATVVFFFGAVVVEVATGVEEETSARGACTCGAGKGREEAGVLECRENKPRKEKATKSFATHHATKEDIRCGMGESNSQLQFGKLTFYH
jgi:hypothetical protein